MSSLSSSAKMFKKNEYFLSYCVFVPLVAFPTLPSTTPQLVFYCLSTLGVNDGGHLSKVFLCYFATVEHCFFSVPSCCTIPFDLDAFRSFSSTTRERSGKKANASFFQPDEQWQRPPIVTPFLVAPWNTHRIYACSLERDKSSKKRKRPVWDIDVNMQIKLETQRCVMAPSLIRSACRKSPREGGAALLIVRRHCTALLSPNDGHSSCHSTQYY